MSFIVIIIIYQSSYKVHLFLHLFYNKCWQFRIGRTSPHNNKNVTEQQCNETLFLKMKKFF